MYKRLMHLSHGTVRNPSHQLSINQPSQSVNVKEVSGTKNYINLMILHTGLIFDYQKHFKKLFTYN